MQAYILLGEGITDISPEEILETNMYMSQMPWKERQPDSTLLEIILYDSKQEGHFISYPFTNSLMLIKVQLTCEATCLRTF